VPTTSMVRQAPTLASRAYGAFSRHGPDIRANGCGTCHEQGRDAAERSHEGRWCLVDDATTAFTGAGCGEGHALSRRSMKKTLDTSGSLPFSTCARHNGMLIGPAQRTPTTNRARQSELLRLRISVPEAHSVRAPAWTGVACQLQLPASLLKQAVRRACRPGRMVLAVV
jgi:hypothetical protein